MRRWLGSRLLAGEAGLTLVELLVASTMGVVLMGAVGSLVISALRDEPAISQKAADVSTARYVMEGLTRELRQGIVVDKAAANSVSFQTYVRRSTCGGAAMLPSTSPAIKCEVTYTCTSTACTRIESAPGSFTGTPVTLVSGLANEATVFTYSPSATAATYVGIKLNIAAPKGPGTTISDGASLRNATLAY
jgi:hypothetical protein